VLSWSQFDHIHWATWSVHAHTCSRFLLLLLLLLVWQAPLLVCSAKRNISLQSGRFWATVIASSRERLFDLRSCWIVFIHAVRGHPGGFLQFSEGEAVMILLASVSSGILAMWPNRERRRAWTIADRRGCPVVRLTSSFRTWWYYLICNNFHKHHWSRASILSTSLLVTVQHSEPYRKIGRMQVLYNFSLVGMVILDFQICLSRFCIATWVMALRREISGVLGLLCINVSYVHTDVWKCQKLQLMYFICILFLAGLYVYE